MALSINDNPPELYLGSATPTHASAGAGFDKYGTVAPDSATLPEIFGPRPWAVACVGSRKEKTVARWMLEKDIPYFLPYLKSKSASGNKVLNPVFDGIVFFESHTDAIPDGYYTGITPREYEVRRAQHVYDLFKTAVQVKFKRELAAIYWDRTVKLGRYAAGEPVRIISGPWVNFTGVALRPENDRVLCNLWMEAWRQWAEVSLHYSVVTSDKPVTAG
jgi:hypothetical protein